MNPLTNQKPLSHSRSLLQKMNKDWALRSQVKKEESNLESLLDPTLPDFRVDLLPFHKHSRFLTVAPSIQQKILSCGWLIYNLKTVDIELKVINPVCEDILYQKLPGVEDENIQEIVADTLIDESFHVKLVKRACSITKQQRGLEFQNLPAFNLISSMQREQDSYSENWQKTIIRLVTAIVSEVFISDYLNLLSDDRKIQPFNRMVVYTHRCDEQAHGCIFKNLTKCIYNQLNPQEKEFFIEKLPLPVRWFANMEFPLWNSLLEQIGFDHTQEMLNDCAADNEVNLMRLDYSGIITLAQELGIFDSQHGIDSFVRQGLFNS